MKKIFLYITLAFLVNINKLTAQTIALASGTYYIVNNTDALTPLAASPGQNVFLTPFDKSGLQQWKINKKINNKGKISYTIRLAGDVDGLWFQAFPAKDHTPIVSSITGNVSYSIVPVPEKPDYWYIKANFYNGDALHSYVFSANSVTELRYDPIEKGNSKYLWQFHPVSND